MNYCSAYCLQSLTLYSPLPSRLDSLTLTITRWFTTGMYIKLKNKLQTYIIKYILSRKLNNKITLIMKRIRTAQYLTDFEINAYTFPHEVPSREELLLRFFRNEKVNYNELVLVNSILKFNQKFFELYYDYYYNGRLPSHSNQKNREIIMEKKYFLNDILDTKIYRMPIYSNNIEPLIIKKRKEKKYFPPQKKVFYNLRR
jgi:hypothetical protein